MELKYWVCQSWFERQEQDRFKTSLTILSVKCTKNASVDPKLSWKFLIFLLLLIQTWLEHPNYHDINFLKKGAQTSLKFGSSKLIFKVNKKKILPHQNCSSIESILYFKACVTLSKDIHVIHVK